MALSCSLAQLDAVTGVSERQAYSSLHAVASNYGQPDCIIANHGNNKHNNSIKAAAALNHCLSACLIILMVPCGRLFIAWSGYS